MAERTLSDRYSIEREIGRGGHAIVYAAHDLKHDRQVALKVLLPEFAASVHKQRLLREIQIASKLSHPHILPLYDFGEADGTLYYVMPFIAGESLRARLQRDKQLSTEEAIRIAHEVASALAYAHKQGFVHRDIKPENILLQENVALVSDFGIARALAQADDAGITQSGIAVGTPEYMSPEQAAASQELDGRSDIYSLACVVYEMLVGHAPFLGISAHEVLSRHALDSVPMLTAARPDVAPALEAVLRKALAKSPAARYATVSEFAAALDAAQPHTTTTPTAFQSATESGLHAKRSRRARVWIAAAGAVALLVAGLFLDVSRRASAKPAALRSLAVLPLVNTTHRADDEYLADGITEDLINTLSSIDSLRVTSRMTAFSYKGKNLDVRQIGSELAAGAVLEGSLQADSNRVIVQVQLVRVADGKSVWGRRYVRGRRDLLAVQEDIARSITDAIELQLLPDARARVGQPHTRNGEAYDLYLRGRYLLDKRTAGALTQAIAHFERAIETDSTYALAYSGLSDSYMLATAPAAGAIIRKAIPGKPGDVLRHLYNKAKAAAVHAIALDPTLAEAHTSLGRVLAEGDWDLKGAEQEYKRAIQLNRHYLFAHSSYGRLLALQGRSDEALREVSLAARADSMAPTFHTFYGNALTMAGKYDQAIAEYQKTLRLSPNARPGELMEAYLAKGDYAAVISAEIRRKQLGGAPVDAGSVGYAEARLGNREKALQILHELQSDPGASRQQIVFLHLGLNDNEAALRELERAITERTLGPYYLASPLLAPIRADPRFRRLQQVTGLLP